MLTPNRRPLNLGHNLARQGGCPGGGDRGKEDVTWPIIVAYLEVSLTTLGHGEPLMPCALFFSAFFPAKPLEHFIR